LPGYRGTSGAFGRKVFGRLSVVSHDDKRRDGNGMTKSFYTALRFCAVIALTRLLAGVFTLVYVSAFGERIFQQPLTDLTGVLLVLVYTLCFSILGWLMFSRKARKPENFPFVSLIALLLSASGRDAYAFGQNLALVSFFLVFSWLIIAVVRFFTRKIPKKELPAGVPTTMPVRQPAAHPPDTRPVPNSRPRYNTLLIGCAILGGSLIIGFAIFASIRLSYPDRKDAEKNQGLAKFRSTATPAPSVVTRPDSIVNKAKAAVVELIAYDANWSPIKTGTGFFITADGELLTNFHVIEGATHISARTEKGAIFIFEKFVTGSADSDVALLKFQAADVDFLKIGTSTNAVEGETVLVIGNPEGLQGTVSNGIISAFRENRPASTTAISVVSKVCLDKVTYGLTCLVINNEIGASSLKEARHDPSPRHSQRPAACQGHLRYRRTQSYSLRRSESGARAASWWRRFQAKACAQNG
jgi:Trypsin-like peptidase domain